MKESLMKEGHVDYSLAIPTEQTPPVGRANRRRTSLPLERRTPSLLTRPHLRPALSYLPAPPRDAAPLPIKRAAAAGGPYGALRTAGSPLRPRPLRVTAAPGAPMRAAALLAALAVLAGAWLRAGRRRWRKGGCRCVC